MEETIIVDFVGVKVEDGDNVRIAHKDIGIQIKIRITALLSSIHPISLTPACVAHDHIALSSLIPAYDCSSCLTFLSRQLRSDSRRTLPV